MMFRGFGILYFGEIYKVEIGLNKEAAMYSWQLFDT